MSWVTENLKGKTALADSLAAGLDDIRYDQTLTFTAYVRVVLPLDKFVFWVRYDQVSQATLTALGIDTDLEWQVTRPCAVHMATDTEQNEDESLDMSSIVVTAEQEIRPFHDTAVNLLWLSEFSGVRFSFNGRQSYYKQSGLHHYTGSTIYPVMLTQIVDDATQLDQTKLVLSNSTALWLSLASSISQYVWLPGFSFPLYPVFQIDDNLVPPYGVIRPLEGTQRAITQGPLYSSNMSRNAYVIEEVDVILYGLNNDKAADFLDSVLGYALSGRGFGVNNSPVLMDESRPQSEVNVIAQKKRIRFTVNYYQSTLRDMAIHLITECIPTFTVE